MSDYLWDKTGERDAEVERLEEMLGKLRHSPRALELPPDARMDAALAPRSFRKAWLTAAAALLLALMAVAFVASRFDKTSGRRQTASQDSQSAPPKSPTPQLPASPDVLLAPQPGIQYVHVEKQGPLQKQELRRVREHMSVVKSEREFIPTAVNVAKKHEGVAIQPLRGSGQEETAARQQLAKEQLVYALRLTSSKLKEVRRKTQGIVDSKSAFDERNP